MEVAAKRIWRFRVGSNFIDVYKNKVIIPFLKEDVLKSEKILLHSCKDAFKSPSGSSDLCSCKCVLMSS